MFSTTKKLKMNFDLDKIKTLAATAEGKKKTNRISNIFDNEMVNQIIEDIKTKKFIETNETVWILVTGVLQRGGSNQKAGNAIKYDFGEDSLTSQELQKFVKTHQKNGTNRQLARSIANEIAKIALEFKIPGDLHAQMKFEYPNMTEDEAVWCSNFQTTNPNCPDTVREWLVDNYRSRFNR
jgi:hypothetical protein